MRITSHKMLCLKPLKAQEKVETKMAGNIALVSQKQTAMEADLAMDFTLSNGVKLIAGQDRVILPGDAAFQGFAKLIVSYNDIDFFRVSEDMIFGYIKGEPQ